MRSVQLGSALFLILLFQGELFSSTYAYFNITGRSEKDVLREQKMVEASLAMIEGAKLLYTHQEKMGFVFKKIVLTMVVEGSAKTLNGLMAKLPYPGDTLKEIVMEMKFQSYNPESGETEVSTLHKRFANIAKTVEHLKGQNLELYWDYLRKRSSVEYKKHLTATGELQKNSKVELHFFTYQPTSENLIFSISKP